MSAIPANPPVPHLVEVPYTDLQVGDEVYVFYENWMPRGIVTDIRLSSNARNKTITVKHDSMSYSVGYPKGPAYNNAHESPIRFFKSQEKEIKGFKEVMKKSNLARFGVTGAEIGKFLGLPPSVSKNAYNNSTKNKGGRRKASVCKSRKASRKSQRK